MFIIILCVHACVGVSVVSNGRSPEVVWTRWGWQARLRVLGPTIMNGLNVQLRGRARQW